MYVGHMFYENDLISQPKSHQNDQALERNLSFILVIEGATEQLTIQKHAPIRTQPTAKQGMESKHSKGAETQGT